MIKKWILKAVVQKSISFLPGKNKINYFFQKYVTKGVALNETYFKNKLTIAKDHLTYLQKYKVLNEVSCLELGSGWYPIVPLSLYLCGAKQVLTIDLSSHLTKAFLLKTFEKFFEWEADEKLNHYLPSINESRWNQFRSVYANQEDYTLNEMLSRLKITAIVGDARKMDLPDHSIDFICSNNTFEHIYPNILTDILTEFKRLIKLDGMMSHLIDMSDHFAHLDKTISAYNFLRFTEKQWSWIDNSIQPQNRMRFHQYQQMYLQLDIPFDTHVVKVGNIDALSNIQLKAPFNAFTKEELAIIHGYMFSKFEPALQSSTYKHANVAQPE